MSFLSDLPSSTLPPRNEARAGALCVTPDGDLLIPGTPAFFDEIGYRNPDFDLADYAIRNMGYVGIRRVSADRLRLRFRPALVTGKALEAVCRYLMERETAEVELDYLTDDWREEIWQTDPTLLHRLAELCATSASASDRKPISVKRLGIEAVAEEYASPLKPLFQKWRVSFGAFNETTLPFLMQHGFGNNLTIVTAPRADAPLRFFFFGCGIRIYDEDVMCELIGNPVTDQPDKEYGAWAGAQYKDLLASNQPRLDEVQATFRHSADTVRRARYERLLLPWRSPTGASIITSATVLLRDERRHLANENEPTPDLPSSGGANGGRPGSKILKIH